MQLPSHSEDLCVSSTVYQLAELPFYYSHYQGNLLKKKRHHNSSPANMRNTVAFETLEIP